MNTRCRKVCIDLANTHGHYSLQSSGTRPAMPFIKRYENSYSVTSARTGQRERFGSGKRRKLDLMILDRTFNNEIALTTVLSGCQESLLSRGSYINHTTVLNLPIWRYSAVNVRPLTACFISQFIVPEIVKIRFLSAMVKVKTYTFRWISLCLVRHQLLSIKNGK